MISEFLQPTENVDVCCVFGDIVDEKSSDGTSVVTIAHKGNVSFKFERSAGEETHAEVIAR